MPKPIVGLHHVTAIASNPQGNLDFYTQVMGLRFVKCTINFDQPDRYHFYFGDDAGSPGTILSFFPWPHADRATPGVGEISATALSVPPSSLNYWEKRLAEAGISLQRIVRFAQEVVIFADPDGMRLEIVGDADAGEANASRKADVPPEHAIRGLFGVTLCEESSERTTAVLAAMGFQNIGEEGARLRFAAPGSALGNHIDVLVEPQLARGQLGAGGVHHLAFRTADEASQLAWCTLLVATSLDVAPVLDQIYFQSNFFREPGGVLFAIATDSPGFTLDEPLQSLGEGLMLPPWMESQRARVEQLLPPIRLTHQDREMSDLVRDPHRLQPVRGQGAALSEASAVVILLHGRGASAEDILGLVDGIFDERIAYMAPQAADHRWYPYSFLAPLKENEPWLSSALAKVGTTMQMALDAGIPRERIVFCGFSQGACLSTEFVARYPARYGGLVAFTGGLIGPPDMDLRHDGDLAAMPAWFSSGDPDPHVPWDRVLASAEQFAAMGAEVHTRRFAGRPHTVLPEEVQAARELIMGMF